MACSSAGVDTDRPAQDTGLGGLALRSVDPGTLVPGSTLVVAGDSFVSADYGTSKLHLSGRLDGAPFEASLPLRFVDYDRLERAYQPGDIGAGSGTFDGAASVQVVSKVDGQTYSSPPLHVTLTLAPSLRPSLDVVGGDVIYVNEPIEVDGAGFLLGGDEGQTFARVEGCFAPTGADGCTPVGPATVAVTPAGPFERARATFAFDPSIAGIQPGTFRGTVTLENQSGDASSDSEPVAVSYTVAPPAIFSVAPEAASLGQYVDVHGGGFVGGDDGVTTIELTGSFTLEGTDVARPVSLTVVPDFQAGPLVRYVLSEDDALGHAINLRTAAGRFEGTVRPVISYGNQTVRGDATAVTLGIAHVKQVVWLRFQPAYIESLRLFGLRAVDRAIRARVFEVARRDYAGVNIEFRGEEPTDFALFSTVDIGGPDLNGLGYFGYDNTPGKDVDNQRLYDQIGGLNATTQEDGSAGYGGVFVESFFAFSKHPNGLAKPIDGASTLFDAVFDPFRPDAGGAAVLAKDIAGGIPRRTSGQGCPATGATRSEQISCAVFVLGSMIGTTMTHEIGHSLGLAAPHGDSMLYHDPGDKPNRLMDAGGARTFNERAELQGEGPAVFCDSEYDYLRQILPSDDPVPAVSRPACN